MKSLARGPASAYEVGESIMRPLLRAFASAGCLAAGLVAQPMTASESFDGRFFAGEGDRDYLELLDIARSKYAPHAEFQNMAILYMPSWNGLVEGPKESLDMLAAT